MRISFITNDANPIEWDMDSPLTLKWLGHFFFFQNVISFSDGDHLMCNIHSYMKLVQHNECLVSIVDTDGLVL